MYRSLDARMQTVAGYSIPQPGGAGVSDSGGRGRVTTSANTSK